MKNENTACVPTLVLQTIGTQGRLVLTGPQCVFPILFIQNVCAQFENSVCANYRLLAPRVFFVLTGTKGVCPFWIWEGSQIKKGWKYGLWPSRAPPRVLIFHSCAIFFSTRFVKVFLPLLCNFLIFFLLFNFEHFSHIFYVLIFQSRSFASAIL